MKSSNRQIAVDFDGVVHDKAHPVKGRRMGPPLPGAKEALEGFIYDGDSVLIHTVMAATTGGIKTVADWMQYYKIPYSSIVYTKPNADVFIDDKAIHHISWGNTLLELGKRL